jgi:hypothetical protein
MLVNAEEIRCSSSFAGLGLEGILYHAYVSASNYTPPSLLEIATHL